MTRALISVSDKTGIATLARTFADAGVELVSTGGTKRALAEAGLAVREVSDLTNFPEMMDGRVKTLHPNVHGGLLALRDRPDHMEAAAKHGIGMIDYVIVNLYPFAQTIAKPDVTLSEAIEQIDVGGPSMLRAAAKNYRFVVVVTDPADYAWIGERVESGTAITENERLELAAKVFRHTAAYDARVASYLTERSGILFPETFTLAAEKVQDLRYGENPQQRAGFYKISGGSGPSLTNARQVQGKELSYNNIQDASAALELIAEFPEPTAVAIKHTNPCGVGTGLDAKEAFMRAYDADPVSIFGGIVAFNREVDEETASKLADLFLEIVLAPAFSPEARKRLARKKNLRVLEVILESQGQAASAKSLLMRSVTGGLLLQEADMRNIDTADWSVVTETRPSDAEWLDLLFAWRVVKHVKSNAIVLAKDGRTTGVGAGQMNRVGAARIAIAQAGALAHGSVLASDAFFPLADTVQAAAAAGVRAIVQPGGSVKDAESVAAANQAGIAMVFTHTRHFVH